MHLKKIILHSEKYPTMAYYPFNQKIFRRTKSLRFGSPVTFFVGENGTGKSTLLRIIAGTLEELPRVDDAIRSHLQNWTFERLKRVDLAILRISAYSLLKLAHPVLSQAS